MNTYGVKYRIYFSLEENGIKTIKTNKTIELKLKNI